MKNLIYISIIALLSLNLSSCKKKSSEDKAETETIEPKVIFVFKFDSTLARLDNFGQPSTIPSGHSAQSPKFNKLSSHYVELAPTAFTPLGSGAVVYRAKETTLGGSNAIDFQYSKLVGNNETFLSIPIKDIDPGTYEWLRVSLAYQNYKIKYKYNYMGTDLYLNGTIASFVGFNTYIKSYQVKNLSKVINGNKLQGYWGFESEGTLIDGQAPAGATTVPNPLSATSPIPAGSCVVTGEFDKKLKITGNETADIIVTVALSTNNSFEWKDFNGDGWYEPTNKDTVVDMGLRGLYPKVQYK